MRYLLALCLLAQTVAVHARDQPNILLLMAEDMSSRVGAFGDAVAVTPNLDSLAEQGVRFDQAFTTAGVCAPSRAAIITGMHQISFGSQHMRTMSRPEGAYKSVPPAEVKAFPELLRRAGYFTYTDHKLDYQFSSPFIGSGPFTIWDDESMAADWTDRANGQPFFAYITFGVSHESGIFRPLGNWPNSALHFAMQVVRYWKGHRVVDGPVTPDQVNLEPYYPDTATVRADIARHYNNITQMDSQVGEVLKRLKSDGLLEKTIVIWTTDHGDGLPRAKRDIYDSGIKVPLIIRWPEQYRPEGMVPGSLDHQLISLIDLAPTILSLAGTNIPGYIQGRSISTAAEDSREYIYASRDRMDGTYDRRRAVRDHRFKYIRNWYPDLPTGHHLNYRSNQDMLIEMTAMFENNQLSPEQQLWFLPTGPEQLFDLDNDPHELNNVSTDPAYANDLARMRLALDDWQSRVADWSEEHENKMVERFMPEGEQLVTAAPTISFVEGRVVITSQTKGASLGYRIDGGFWQLYSEPVELGVDSSIEAKAVRYGWEESGVVELELLR